MTSILSTRNASIEDLVRLMQTQHTRRLDVVAGSGAIRVKDGKLIVKGVEPELTSDGVNMVDGTYLPTAVFDEGVANRLDIPVGYLKRLRQTRTDIYDATVNAFLHGKTVRRASGDTDVIHEPDARNFLIRAYRGDDTGEGVARALLSDKYGALDNLDITMATLAGLEAAGIDPQSLNLSGDITERRMYLRISAPHIQALAPQLLSGYRSPYTGQTGDENPTVFAGIVVSNSEVGNGAFTVTPRLTVEVCTNGMTISKDVQRAVHLGSRMEEGLIEWSADTQRKQLELVTAKARDAVTTFMSPGYVERAIKALEAEAGVAVDPIKATDTIAYVGKKLGWTQTEQDGILGRFIQGQQLTSGGILQAATAYAQDIEDADASAELEAHAVEAMSLAAVFAR